MELSDKIKIDAPRERVFAALNDIDILREAIPGCETIEANGTDAYTATVTQKVGPLKARFKGDVTLSNIVAPESYTLEGAGKARNVVLEFESYDDAVACYNSEEYQAARKFRAGAGDADIVIVEGV